MNITNFAKPLNGLSFWCLNTRREVWSRDSRKIFFGQMIESDARAVQSPLKMQVCYGFAYAENSFHSRRTFPAANYTPSKLKYFILREQYLQKSFQ